MATLPRSLRRCFTTLTLFIAMINNGVLSERPKHDYLVVFLPQHVDAPQNGSNILEITATVDTRVTMEIPFLKEVRELVVLSGEASHIELPGAIRTSLGEFRSKKSILIQSSRPLFIKGLNVMDSSADSFLVLGLTEKFTRFYAMSYTETYVRPKCLLAVTSLKAHNIVRVKSSSRTSFLYDERYYRNGEELRVRLDRLEVLQVESYDVTGLQITSDSPISVFSGCNCVFVPRFTEYCDHVVEQIPPVAAWGNEFFSAALFPRRSGEIYRVLSSCNTTQVSLNGNNLGHIGEGDYLEFKTSPSGTFFIHCSSPCLVALFVQGYAADNITGDPAMIIIPHIGQYVSSAMLSTNLVTMATVDGHKSYFDISHFIMILAKTVSRNGFLLDQKAVHGNKLWTGIPNSEFSVAILRLGLGHHLVQHINKNVKFGIISYGLGVGISYGHPAGLELINIPRQRCASDGHLGPASIQAEEISNKLEVIKKESNISTVLPLTCLCLLFMLTTGVLLVYIRRLRHRVNRVHNQGKIIIVPRPSQSIDRPMTTAPPIPQTRSPGIRYADIRARDNEPNYIELI